MDKNPTLTRGWGSKSPKCVRRVTWLNKLTNVLPAEMQNDAKRGAPGLPSGAAYLVSKWVFCTISAKKTPEKFLRLELCVLLSVLLSLGTVRRVLLTFEINTIPEMRDYMLASCKNMVGVRLWLASKV